MGERIFTRRKRFRKLNKIHKHIKSNARRIVVGGEMRRKKGFCVDNEVIREPFERSWFGGPFS